MMKPQPMLVVADVEAASAWFQNALGLTSGHGGDEYEMLMDGDEMVVQLHHRDPHEHPYLLDFDDPSRGNGVALWFSTDAFADAVARISAAGAEVLEGPLFNPLAHHDEIWLRSPDSYVIVVSGPYKP